MEKNNIFIKANTLVEEGYVETQSKFLYHQCNALFINHQTKSFCFTRSFQHSKENSREVLKNGSDE